MPLDQIALLSAGGGLLLGAFLLVRLLGRAQPLSGPERLLGLLIAACALNAAHPALMRLFGSQVRASGQFFEPLQFVLAPLLASYTLAAVRGTFRARAKHLLHLIPFLGAVATSSWFTFHGRVPVTISVVMWAILTIQMGAYLGPALRLLRRYRSGLVDRVSNLEPVDLDWLRRLFWMAAGLCLVSLVVLVSLLHHLTPTTLGAGTSIALTMAVWFLGSRGLEQRFPEPDEPVIPAASAVPAPSGMAAEVAPPAEDASVPAANPSVEKPLLAPEIARQIRASLDQIFASKKPHLDPDLSLASLAQLVGVPRNQLSFVINSELGVNFYDLVNGWRVREFRALAADSRRDEDKILTLAFDAGFSSKPTFNKVVLKLTGKTPTQVRQDEIESRRVR